MMKKGFYDCNKNENVHINNYLIEKIKFVILEDTEENENNIIDYIHTNKNR